MDKLSPVQVDDAECIFRNPKLILQSNGIVNTSEVEKKMYSTRCQLYDCKWEFVLDARYAPMSKELTKVIYTYIGVSPIKQTDNQPKMSIKATRILILLTIFFSIVIGYCSLLLILWIHLTRRDRRLLAAYRWRQKIHMNDTIPPEYPKVVQFYRGKKLNYLFQF